MRDRSVVWLSVMTLALSTGAIACGDDEDGAGGSGGSNPTSSTTTASSMSTTGSSSSSTGGGPCSPTAACMAADKSCIGLVDNAGQTKFGLRMSQLELTAPAAFSSPIFKGLIAGSVAPSVASCNINGSATFNWLLQFDTGASKLKIGGAKPVSDPSAGYSFTDEMIDGHQVSPALADTLPDANGKFSTGGGTDLIMPLYLDASATQVLLLPLKQVRLTNGVLSASHNCIGHYNAEGLDPLNSCLPDDMNPAFVNGAMLDAHMTLEDADTVLVDSLQQTLCVFLSGNAAMYGQANAGGFTECKRTGGVIDFKGDWCSALDMAGGCQDSMHLAGQFAASSIKINN